MNKKILLAVVGTTLCLQGCGSFQMKWPTFTDSSDKTNEPVAGEATNTMVSLCLTALRTKPHAPPKPSSNELTDRRRSYQPTEHQPVGGVITKAVGIEKFSILTRVIPISTSSEDVSGLVGLGECTILKGLLTDVRVFDVEVGH